MMPLDSMMAPNAPYTRSLPPRRLLADLHREAGVLEQRDVIRDRVGAEHRKPGDFRGVDLEGDERQPAAGAQDAEHLAKRGALAGRVLQRVDAHHRISQAVAQASVLERPRREAGSLRQADVARPLPGYG